MPRSAGWSGFTTLSWWCFNPRASSGRRSNAGRPIPERTWTIRSGPLPGGGSTRSRPGLRLRYFRVGGSLAMHGLLPGLVVDRLELHAALPRHVTRRREVLQAVECGPYHIMRVGRAEALREDVAHSGALQHRAYRAARDDPGARRRGLEEHAPGAVVADDLVRNRGARERHLQQATARGFDGLADRFADLVRLPRRDPDVPAPIANGDQRVEAEAPAPLHHLGHTVDRDDVLDEPVALALALARIAPLATPSATATATTPAASATPSTPSTAAAAAATAATAAGTRSRTLLGMPFAARVCRLGRVRRRRSGRNPRP